MHTSPPEESEPKAKQVVDYHYMVVYQGMIDFARNKHELAAVIAHEFAHLELQHTQMDNHDLYREYDADLLSIYYLSRAGYDICAVSQLWKRMDNSAIILKPSSHPLKSSRAKYMKMPRCNDKPLRPQLISTDDVHEVYRNISKHVEARIRYNTVFAISSMPFINAYVMTFTKDAK